MASVLFVTWDGGGNLAPALGIAGALAQRGQTVEFLGHGQQESAIRARGFGFHPFRHAAAWPPAPPADTRPGPRPLPAVFTDDGMGLDLVELAHRQPFDLIVVDHLLWGALKAAQDNGLAHATLVHTLLGQQRDAWSKGPGADLAASQGYKPVELWFRSQLVMVATLPETDPASGDELPENVHFTGPVWQGHPAPAIASSEPLALVSLSTLPQPGQAAALQTILDGLAGMPLRAVATTGGSVNPSDLKPPHNVEVVAFADHAEVMARASLVITHGGHATAMAALSRDLPLLLIPMFPLGDQPVIASILQSQGAGIALSKDCSAGQVTESVQMLLGDPAYRKAASRLGEVIRRRDGAETAADQLMETMRIRVPAADAS